jgi:hypothetical protein
LTEGQRILFIGGLHRSGTTPLARWISQHPAVSAFRDTGVYQDEGQHLQDVYATAAHHGGPGRFAFDGAAHLTEASPLVSEQSRNRIWTAWSAHWDLEKPVLVEKSPPNLVRMRFLQALFPSQAYCLAVIRHPIAVAYATKRWTQVFRWVSPRASRRLPVLQAGVKTLLRHWISAHERFLEDAAFLENVRVVRYEDLVGDPAGQLAGISRFVGLEPAGDGWEVKAALNDRYLDRWERRRATLVGRAYLRHLERRLEERVRAFGYSLSEPAKLLAPGPAVKPYLVRG